MSNTDMSNDPDELRRDIERTRENLSQNVNALGEAVDPGAVAKRQVEKVQDKVMGVGQGLKEKVMGSDDDYGNNGVAAKFADAGDKVGELAGSAKSSVENAPAAAKRKAQGNPLAAGLIALGAGWLLGSLLPASQRERELTDRAKDVIEDKGQPLLDEVKSAAQDVAENLKAPAQEAAAALKDSAQESVEKVKSEGQDAAAQVKASAKDSAETVQQQAK
mgnify:CR=1 FL=1